MSESGIMNDFESKASLALHFEIDKSLEEDVPLGVYFREAGLAG